MNGTNMFFHADIFLLDPMVSKLCHHNTELVDRFTNILSESAISVLPVFDIKGDSTDSVSAEIFYSLDCSMFEDSVPIGISCAEAGVDLFCLLLIRLAKLMFDYSNAIL